jgi:hypothetical protein
MTNITPTPEIEISCDFQPWERYLLYCGTKIEISRAYSIGKYINGNTIFFDIEST